MSFVVRCLGIRTRIARALRTISSATAAAGVLSVVPLHGIAVAGVPFQHTPIPICVAGQTTIIPCQGVTDTIVLGHGSQHTFVVLSARHAAATYTVSCASTPPISNCAVDPIASVAAIGTTLVTVSYAVQDTPGTGTVIVGADAGGADRVAAVVTVVAVTAAP